MVRTALSTLVAAAALSALPHSITAQDVSGTWDATWAQAVTVARDGRVGIAKWGKATLRLHQVGDSVTGTWTTTMVQTVHWKVSGTVHDGRLTLHATENDATDPDFAAITELRWSGTVKGDTVEGNMVMELRGSTRERPERPWRAKRTGKR